MKVMEAVSVFSSRGQIVIPRKIRRDLGIEEGTRVGVAVEGDGIVLRPITERAIRASFGRLKGKPGLAVLAEDRARERGR
jgi:AbrB family looped-hinge helix DNA binding protein